MMIDEKDFVMKKNHVCAIGNALVDVEYYVDLEQFCRLNLEKNVMTLIDEDRRLALMQQLQAFEQGRYCAGSAGNTMMMIAQLGGKAFYSCKVANDKAGDFFVADLRRFGIDSNLHYQERKPGHTGTCLVILTPDAQRTMNTHLGITETFSKTEIHPIAIATSHYLYIEGYLAASHTAKEAAIYSRQLAQHYNTKVALTLSDYNMVKYFKNELIQIMGDRIDLLFCNEVEAQTFCGSTDRETICKRLQDYARTFVVTLGDRGAWIYDGQQLHEQAAIPVHAHDTVGAGDVFAGSFLYAITHDCDYETAGDIANFAASRVICRPGPRLDANDILEVSKKFTELKLQRTGVQAVSYP